MEDLDTTWYRRQFDTNFFGLLNTVYAVLPYLVERRGRLALVSSVAGRAGTPGTSAYASSKFAVTGLAEAVYYELADRGVSVTCIQPGFVTSDIRRIDNRGVLHKKAKDPVPAWLVVPADKAARSIVRYIYRRKFDAVITAHGKVLVWMARHLSCLMRTAMRLGTRGKNLPKKNRAK
jgi:short-subunit dehydrogenase